MRNCDEEYKVVFPPKKGPFYAVFNVFALSYCCMMHRYCPSCGSLDLKRLAMGGEECTRCKFRGEAKEGSMDEIDAFRKSKRPLIAPSAQRQDVSGQKISPPLKDRLAALKGKKTDDFEII